LTEADGGGDREFARMNADGRFTTMRNYGAAKRLDSAVSEDKMPVNETDCPAMIAGRYQMGNLGQRHNSQISSRFEMNRIVRLAVIFSCAVIPVATVSAKVKVSEVAPPSGTLLLDFGNNQSYRGVSTPSPDRKGNFWNSVWAGALNSPLTNAAGGVTTLGLAFDASAGADYYNGPSGATQNPSACVIDADALGNLGINEAVYDYYVNSAFQIQGLDPAKAYSLTFFGSHKYSASDYTTYSICRDASYSRVLTSIRLYVQSPGNPGAHNSNKVATISRISPQNNGIIYIKFQGTNRDSTVGGYLNCLQIVEIPPTNAPPPPPQLGNSLQ
jgi:hypothetical protein